MNPNCTDWQEALTLAKLFHETYERLAPEYGYETRVESRVPWHELPSGNQQLMIAVCGTIRRCAKV